MPDEKLAPKFLNAPGLVVRPRKVGFTVVWQARTDMIQRGFTPKSHRIAKVDADPTQAERDFISDQCSRLQNEMMVWSRGGIPLLGSYDGTIAALINCYRTDKDSNYHSLRFKTREHYDLLCARIVKDYGHKTIVEIDAREAKHWHEQWAESGEAIAHALVTMLRTAVGFGKTFLKDTNCKELKEILSDMRFMMPKKRNTFITAEQVVGVRRAAHARKYPSVALAQAFQFDLMLRQKDVVGEWVPQSEPGLSDVLSGNDKWSRGICWEAINSNGILKHITSKRQKEIVFDLHNAPMVLEELAHSYPGSVTDGLVNRDLLPASGPIILSPWTQLPFITWEFRRQWRLAARAAGVPDGVFNMDSRSGAITEALLAGADIESVRHAATHSNITTTQGYSRGAAEHASKVAKTRIGNRK